VRREVSPAEWVFRINEEIERKHALVGSPTDDTPIDRHLASIVSLIKLRAIYATQVTDQPKAKESTRIDIRPIQREIVREIPPSVDADRTRLRPPPEWVSAGNSPRLWDDIPNGLRVDISRQRPHSILRCKGSIRESGGFNRCAFEAIERGFCANHYLLVTGHESTLQLERQLRQIELERKRNPMRLTDEDCHATTGGDNRVPSGAINIRPDRYYSSATAMYRRPAADHRPLSLRHPETWSRRYEGFPKKKRWADGRQA
jgi:hypothetical protein